MRFKRNNSLRKNKITSGLIQKGIFLSIIFILIGSWWTWNQFFLAHQKESPANGGIYTEATVGNIINLNPLSPNSSDLDKDLQQLIFAGLLKYNPKTEIFESDLADLEQVDNKTYKLTLKKSSKFSDGKSVTVSDVLFTFQDLIQNAAFPHETLKQNFEYVQIAPDGDRSILFTLPEQNTFFTSLLTTPILPHKYFQDFMIEEIRDPEYKFNKHPIGAGPFQLKNIVPNQNGGFRVFLEKNPYYHKRAHISQVVFYVYSSEDQLMSQHEWPSLITRLGLKNIEHFKEQLFEEYTVKGYNLPQYTGVFFNLDSQYTKFKKFRKALKSSFIGHKLLPKDWQEINGPFFLRGIGQSELEVDHRYSRKLLRDGGFPFNKSEDFRTFGKDGDSVEIKIITTAEPAFYAETAQKVARVWEKELDITVKTIVLQKQEFIQALKNRDYDVVLFGEDFTENFDDLSIWHASQTDKLNLSNLTRDDTDSMIAEARFSGSAQDFALISRQLEKITPAIIFATPKYGFLIKNDLYNFSDNLGKIRHLKHRFTEIDQWYFSTEKSWDIPNGKTKWQAFWQWVF